MWSVDAPRTRVSPQEAGCGASSAHPRGSQSPAPTHLLSPQEPSGSSLPLGLPVLNISCGWNHTACGLLCLSGLVGVVCWCFILLGC